MKILFICLGNICRSPIAEGVLTHLAGTHDLGHWQVASASTNTYHTGEAPHPMSQKICLDAGIDISRQRARRITPADMEDFDVIFVMAADVMNEVKRLTGTAFDSSKVRYFMETLSPGGPKDVPDPWYGGWEDFVGVYDTIYKGCEKIIGLYK